MKKQTIILCYRTDNWHSFDSRELLYIGTDTTECIEKLKTLPEQPLTDDQANDIYRHGQSSDNSVDYDWLFEEQNVHDYVDEFFTA